MGWRTSEPPYWGWVEIMQTVGSSTDDRSERAPAKAGGRSDRLMRSIGLLTFALCAGVVVAFVVGFVWFVRMLPTEEITLDRNADGIVALTGGASRVIDALTLLAEKRGQRLLISGANPSTSAKEISRLHPEFDGIVHCCVDFDRSLNTLGNAAETRKWAKDRNIRSLIVVTSGYHMPRALAEIGHQLPGVTLIAFPVISEQIKAEPLWPDGARRLMLEYLKFMFAHIRMRVNPAAGATG
jgi:uncharacterized SAM-binding protein YcdF (DUF218 family)